MGDRHRANLPGALATSSGEHEGTLGYIPPFEPPLPQEPYMKQGIYYCSW